MLHSISRRWWLGILGVTVLGAMAPANAWGDGPNLRNTRVRVNFNVEMSTLPSMPPPTAPWYAYFPADPRIMPSPQLSPYPPWPQQFPPPGLVPMPPPTPVSRPMVAQHWAAQGVQPVGFYPTQAPSYWYQNR
jgi:hypothetical protein